jgi:hypothetical protein
MGTGWNAVAGAERRDSRTATKESDGKRSGRRNGRGFCNVWRERKTRMPGLGVCVCVHRLISTNEF